MSGWKVNKEEVGMRLPHFIQLHLKKDHQAELSLKEIKNGIEQNRAQVNRKPEKFSSYLVRENDHISFLYDKKEKKQEISILYEDKWLMVVNKPPFVVSDAEKGILGHHLVHRLDKETSGCLLLAKEPETEAALLLMFKERAVQKEYLAVVEGYPKKPQGTINTPIGDKTAKTSWRRGQKGKKAVFMHCYPETGRTHQIRIHLAEIGLPILGDWKYGKFNHPFDTKRILLHAVSISFIHPETLQTLKIEAPIPKEFYEALDR